MSDLLGEKADDFEDIYYFEKIIYMEIYQAIDIKRDKQVTLKFVNKDKFKNYDMRKEKEIVDLCLSKNILKIYDYFETEKHFIVEQESYETNLFEYIKENGPAQDYLSFFKGVFLEVAKALKFIHEKGIMHRCIRTNHIFLVNKKNEDDNDLEYSVKLGGFNFAKYIKDNNSEPLDTIFYTAPEIINGEEYNEKCDLWSFGITLYQLYFGKFPYGFKPSKYMVVKLVNDEEGFNYEKTNLPALDDIFNGLLQINPKKRLTHEQFFDLVFNYDIMDEQVNQSFKEKYDEYMNLNAKESEKT
jgi:serine/threonine protein kinase